MNKLRITMLSLLLAACLAFAGCGPASGLIGGKATAAPAGKDQTASETAKNPSGESAATAIPTSEPKAQSFADAFTAVEQNPLHESIQIALWLAATSSEEPADPGAAGGSALKELADKYAAIVADKGVHYIEVTGVWGMSVKAEYWVKDGMFKKWEPDTKKVTLFDGQHYIQYDSAEKKGTRFNASYAAAELAILTKGMIASLATAPYQQKEDKKVGKYNCSVFVMDMEVMGMKGSTLYVDKQTGLLVKNQTGDPKDKKNSMSVTVELFEAGGFGDEVFTVPDDITVEDYQ